mmetsp:Transcript_62066/g.176313  ORF Transcript_62066/g.176313 Transcript_62066/m.176313 type:complete len:201 (-) Transcript_62066:152-754(-)
MDWSGDSSMREKCSGLYGQACGAQPCCAWTAMLTGALGFASASQTSCPWSPGTAMPTKRLFSSTACRAASQSVTERFPPTSTPLPETCSRSRKWGTSPTRGASSAYLDATASRAAPMRSSTSFASSPTSAAAARSTSSSEMSSASSKYRCERAFTSSRCLPTSCASSIKLKASKVFTTRRRGLSVTPASRPISRSGYLSE